MLIIDTVIITLGITPSGTFVLVNIEAKIKKNNIEIKIEILLPTNIFTK